MKHNHKEAFCHMQYHGFGVPGRIFLTIWNSRDGVTPFITICKQYGIELQHVNYEQDRYDPDYKPKKGDLIWRDWTLEEAKESGRRLYNTRVKEYKEVKDLSPAEIEARGFNGWDPVKVLKYIVDKGEEAAINDAVENLYNQKQPKLELVANNWE